MLGFTTSYFVKRRNDYAVSSIQQNLFIKKMSDAVWPDPFPDEFFTVLENFIPNW